MDWAVLEAQWAEEDAADERLAAASPDGPEVLKAGFWDRAGGEGCGFAAGGVADTLAPGPVLAGLAGRAWVGGLPELSDDELVGVLRAARRLASWAAALEFAAAADLMRRRLAEEQAGQARVAEHAVDEIAVALTLTGRSADRLLSLAMTLDGLPATSAALAAGEIDPPKAAVIADETAALGPSHRRAVEQHVLTRAGGQTTGELRAATRRAVIAADPAAARQRKERAQQDARVERWEEEAGTAALAGRDLPAAHVLAADHNLTHLARELKAAGASGTIDSLRARVFLTLLAGQPISSVLPPGTGDTQAGAAHFDTAGLNRTSAETSPAVRAASAGPAPAGPAPAGPASAYAAAVAAAPATPGWDTGACQPALTGGVNLTLPLATWLGTGDAPGNVAGSGPLDAADSRTLAAALAARAGSTWCITLTDAGGRPVAHGCVSPRPRSQRSRGGPPGGSRAGPRARTSAAAGGEGAARAAPGHGGPAWNFSITPLAGEPCTHARESGGYRPSPSLRHVLHVRNATCTFPGCRRPAVRCDQDHTIPYSQGGRTCECNLAARCRHHHKAKQAPGWRLVQPRPGVLEWTTPSGRTYTIRPTQYPE